MAVPAFPAGDEQPAPPIYESPEPELGTEGCTISRWRGYRSSTFVALLDDGSPVAESTDFRWRGGSPPPDSGAPRQAFEELCAELRRLGWSDAGTEGDDWYAGRFTRPVAEPAYRAEAEPAPAPPREPALPVEPERRQLREAVAPPAPPPVRVERPVEPERRVLREAAPEPHAVPAPPARTARGGRKVTIISVAGIAVAIALTAFIALQPKAGHGARHVATVPTATPKPKHVVPAATTAAVPVPTPAPAVVRLVIAAGARPSWLEVRRGSATGRTLFSGQIVPGQVLHFSSGRLWARFGAAGNLIIRENGRPVGLNGTIEHVFAAKR